MRLGSVGFRVDGRENSRIGLGVLRPRSADRNHGEWLLLGELELYSFRLSAFGGLLLLGIVSLLDFLGRLRALKVGQVDRLSSVQLGLQRHQLVHRPLALMRVV